MTANGLTAATMTARTQSCAADLLTNGIDVRQMADGPLNALIARERDYFELMLGADTLSDRQIFHLLRGSGQPRSLKHPRPAPRLRRPHH